MSKQQDSTWLVQSKVPRFAILIFLKSCIIRFKVTETASERIPCYIFLCVNTYYSFFFNFKIENFIRLSKKVKFLQVVIS
jgi:hypothetical protein